MVSYDSSNASARVEVQLPWIRRVSSSPLPVSILQQALDPDFAILSLSLVPIVAKLFIHWSNITGDGRTIYHMYRVRNYLLEEEDHMVGLRHD